MKQSVHKPVAAGRWVHEGSQYLSSQVCVCKIFRHIYWRQKIPGDLTCMRGQETLLGTLKNVV